MVRSPKPCTLHPGDRLPRRRRNRLRGGVLQLPGLLAFAGQQVANGANDLATQVSAGLDEVKNWLKTGPLHVSDQQINDYIQKASNSLKQQAETGKVLSQVTNIGSALTHILAGLFLVLFSTYFFLADGDRIWSWIVRIAVNQALMKLRRRKTDKSVSLDEQIDTGEDTVVREIAAWGEDPE